MSSILTLVSVSGLLDLLLKSAAIVLLAAVVASLSGRASAAWRHLVWRLSVASLLLLPALSLALPDWRVGWLPQWPARQTQFAAAGLADHAGANRTQPTDDVARVFPAAPVELTEAESHNGAANLPPDAAEMISPPRSALPWLAIIWLAGGMLSLVPLAIGLWQLARLRRRSQVVADRRWLTLLDELRRQLAVRRRVQLRQCDAALAPLTWGALRPVVLLPCEADVWPDERRRLVLLHELAHVRHWDWLTQLAAHIACAMYWFNPLVRLAARQLRIESERACDDRVLASGARASDYARELLALAAALSNSRPSLLAAMPMARRRDLEDRLRGILDSRRSRAALTRTAVCLGVALAAVALTPLAMLRAATPELAESKAADATKEPPAAPAVSLGAAGRQMKEGNDDRAPLTLAHADARKVWNLTLEEAVRTALANSKVLRNLGGVLYTAVVPQSELTDFASRGAKGSGETPETIRGEKVRFVLARTNDDVPLVDFESSVRNLVYDVERAYWELYYNYRNLAAMQAGRDSALQVWRKDYTMHDAGGNDGEAEKEAREREHFFLFRAQAENSLGMLYSAEGRLRHMMGLAATDGRLIRPADEPTTAEVRFDLTAILPETLKRRIELSHDQEVEVVHLLTNSVRDLDRNYQVSVTTFNRRLAAAKQAEAVKASYDAGTVTLDMLLDAQRRLADAEIGYFRALVDYNAAILQVHFRKGSLLERNGILLAEGTRTGSDIRNK